MKIKKEILLEQLKNTLLKDPSWSCDVLLLVSNALKEYENAVENKRNSEAWHAINDMFVLVNYPYPNNGRRETNELTREQTIHLAPAIAFDFPLGFQSTGSVLRHNVLVLFCENYFDRYGTNIPEAFDSPFSSKGYSEMLKKQWEKYKLEVENI